MRKLVLFIVIMCISVQYFAQQSKNTNEAFFGFQFKPLIPGDFIAKSTVTAQNEDFSATFSQKLGYSFGVSTRIKVTKLINFETGINQVKRNYQVDYALPDSALFGTNYIGIISYDIPLNAMIYIQLTEKLFLNTSLGASFVYYPSNVGRTLPVDNRVIFSAEGRRYRRFDMETNANFGFEWRTASSGFFYLGASGKIPFKPIFRVAGVYEFPFNQPQAVTADINGAYISIDFRYLLPYVKSKGSGFKEGPIIQ